MRVRVYYFAGKHGPFTVPERWCVECDLTVQAVQRAALEFPEARVEVVSWFRHLPAALLRGVWHPPGVVVDGKRVIQARVPKPELLRQAFLEARARRAARAKAAVSRA